MIGPFGIWTELLDTMCLPSQAQRICNRIDKPPAYLITLPCQP